MKKFIPNILSIMQMFVAVLLLLTAPLSSAFNIVYILCGITDVEDGFLARQMKCGSRLSAILDSIADFMFVAYAVIAMCFAVYSNNGNYRGCCKGGCRRRTGDSYNIGQVLSRYKRNIWCSKRQK